MSTIQSTVSLRLDDADFAGKLGKDAAALKGFGAAGKDLKLATPAITKLNAELETLAGKRGRLDGFRQATKNVDALGQSFRRARGDVEAIAKTIEKRKASLDYFESRKVSEPARYARWKKDGLVKGVQDKLKGEERAYAIAAKRRDKAKSAFMEGARDLRAQRNALLADGVQLTGPMRNGRGQGLNLGAAERDYKAATQAANAELERQVALLRRVRSEGTSAARTQRAQSDFVARMGSGDNRRQMADAASRRMTAGMVAAGGAAPVVVPVGGEGLSAAERRAAVRAQRERERAAARHAKAAAENHAGAGESLVALGGLHHMGQLAAGFTAYEAVKETYKAQTHQQHERVRQRASGMSEGEVGENSRAAMGLSGRYRAFSQTEIMHGLRNARSIVGDFHEAQAVMEPMLQLRTVALGANPEKRQELEADFDKLIKGMEIKGVTQDMPKFVSYMNGMAKAMNMFGDTLRPTDYYEMFKYGRQATQGLSEEYMNSVAPTIAQELGGSSGGVAHAAFFRAIVGGKMANNATEALKHIGLLGEDDLIKTKTGAVKGIKPGHRVAGADLAQSNPFQWVQQYLVPALEKHGLTSPERMQETIGHIFSNQVAAQLVSLLATQKDRINKDTHLLQGAEGLSAAQRFQQQDPIIAWQSVKAQAENAFAAIGGFNKSAAALSAASELLAHVAATWNRQNEGPEATKNDRTLSPESLAKLGIKPDTRTEAQQKADAQADTDAAAVTDRKNAIARERDALAEHVRRLDGVDAAGGLGAIYGRGGREKERVQARARLAELERQREAIDEAVARRDWAKEDVDRNAAAIKGADVRFSRGNQGRAIGPVGAWGLNGASGLDRAPEWGGRPQAPAGPVTVPLPPRRPPDLAGTVPQQLKDLKDILGGGSDGLNPVIAPKVDASHVEELGTKSDAAKEKLSALGATSAAPQVSSASVDAFIGKVDTAIAKVAQLGSAAASANASIASVGSGGSKAASAGGQFNDGGRAGYGTG